MKKVFKGGFMKEAFAETAILSALIILPMAFLGPGWNKRQHKPFAEAHSPQSGRLGGAFDDMAVVNTMLPQAASKTNEADRLCPEQQSC